MFCTSCQSFWDEALRSAYVPAYVTKCEDIEWTKHASVLHRSLRSLATASETGCPVCRAVLFTPTSYEKLSLLTDLDEQMDIILEIEQKNSPHPALSASFVETGSQKVKVPKRMIAACAGLITDNELRKAIERNSKLGNASTGSDASLALGLYWLQKCTKEHEKCHVEPPGGGLSFVPTRLLDVSGNNVRLIEAKKELEKAGADRRYAALSHCWGKVQIITTRKENYAEHLIDIPSGQLSKTFSEAIHTVRKLDLRYIWIDSMCIIQNDKDDWAAEAVTMCDVYRNSAVTIYAAHASGGNIGCFEDRDGVQSFPFLVDIPNTQTTSTRDSVQCPQIMFTAYGRGKGARDGDPPLFGRAWVLQEQVLSPRMLIFDGDQIRWECLATHGSERSPNGGMTRLDLSTKYIRESIAERSEFFDLADFDDKVFAARAKHQSWLFVTMDYTHRGMTEPGDRLIAIDGIAQALARKTKTRYLAGLWENYLWVGLLWSISHAQVFRGTTTAAFEADRNQHIRHYNRETKVREDMAPSWSWVSITAPALYPEVGNMSMDRICEILSAKVDGLATKKTGEVSIRGHARKGYVKAIYPYTIREAAQVPLEMMTAKPSGSAKADEIEWQKKRFHAEDFFIFSDSPVNKPTNSLGKLKNEDWKLVRGTFRPDELINPAMEMTFLAIAQDHRGPHPGRHTKQDPVLTYTLALLPSGNAKNEYRRVGYAEWEDCAWFGYMCGDADRPGKNYENREHGWRGLLPNNPELYRRRGKGQHRHDGETGKLPDLQCYEKGIQVEDMVVNIV